MWGNSCGESSYVQLCTHNYPRFKSLNKFYKSSSIWLHKTPITKQLIYTFLCFSYVCNCSVGYTGLNCSEEINECQSDPCQNNATCRDLIADYQCLCRPGYTGKDCDTPLITPTSTTVLPKSTASVTPTTSTAVETTMVPSVSLTTSEIQPSPTGVPESSISVTSTPVFTESTPMMTDTMTPSLPTSAFSSLVSTASGTLTYSDFSASSMRHVGVSSVVTGSGYGEVSVVTETFSGVGDDLYSYSSIGDGVYSSDSSNAPEIIQTTVIPSVSMLLSDYAASGMSTDLVFESQTLQTVINFETQTPVIADFTSAQSVILDEQSKQTVIFSSSGLQTDVSLYTPEMMMSSTFDTTQSMISSEYVPSQTFSLDSFESTLTSIYTESQTMMSQDSVSSRTVIEPSTLASIPSGLAPSQSIDSLELHSATFSSERMISQIRSVETSPTATMQSSFERTTLTPSDQSMTTSGKDLFSFSSFNTFDVVSTTSMLSTPILTFTDNLPSRTDSYQSPVSSDQTVYVSYQSVDPTSSYGDFDESLIVLSESQMPTPSSVTKIDTAVSPDIEPSSLEQTVSSHIEITADTSMELMTSLIMTTSEKDQVDSTTLESISSSMEPINSLLPSITPMSAMVVTSEIDEILSSSPPTFVMSSMIPSESFTSLDHSMDDFEVSATPHMSASSAGDVEATLPSDLIITSIDQTESMPTIVLSSMDQITSSAYSLFSSSSLDHFTTEQLEVTATPGIESQPTEMMSYSDISLSMIDDMLSSVTHDVPSSIVQTVFTASPDVTSYFDGMESSLIQSQVNKVEPSSSLDIAQSSSEEIISTYIETIASTSVEKLTDLTGVLSSTLELSTGLVSLTSFTDIDPIASSIYDSQVSDIEIIATATTFVTHTIDQIVSTVTPEYKTSSVEQVDLSQDVPSSSVDQVESFVAQTFMESSIGLMRSSSPDYILTSSIEQVEYTQTPDIGEVSTDLMPDSSRPDMSESSIIGFVPTPSLISDNIMATESVHIPLSSFDQIVTTQSVDILPESTVDTMIMNSETVTMSLLISDTNYLPSEVMSSGHNVIITESPTIDSSSMAEIEMSQSATSDVKESTTMVDSQISRTLSVDSTDTVDSSSELMSTEDRIMITESPTILDSSIADIRITSSATISPEETVASMVIETSTVTTLSAASVDLSSFMTSVDEVLITESPAFPLSSSSYDVGISQTDTILRVSSEQSMIMDSQNTLSLDITESSDLFSPPLSVILSSIDEVLPTAGIYKLFFIHFKILIYFWISLVMFNLYIKFFVHYVLLIILIYFFCLFFISFILLLSILSCLFFTGMFSFHIKQWCRHYEWCLIIARRHTAGLWHCVCVYLWFWWAWVIIGKHWCIHSKHRHCILNTSIRDDLWTFDHTNWFWDR